jgi:hypothetical protein
MVSSSIPMNSPILNRRLRRSIRRHTLGPFDKIFGHVRNSPFEAQHFFDLFMTAARNREDGMANEASHTLNEQAMLHGAKPLYTRGRRVRDDGTYSNNSEFLSKKYYPSSKTMLNRIKKSFEISAGELLPSSKSGRHVNFLQREVNRTLQKATSSNLINPLTSLTGITVALDFHDQDFYGQTNLRSGQKNLDVINTFGKHTTLAYRFCTSRILSDGGQFCTRPILTKSTTHAIETSHNEYRKLNIVDKTYVADREFCGIHEINTFRKLGLDYITPVRRNILDTTAKQRIKNAPDEHVTIIDYTVGHTPKHSARTFIVVVPPKWQCPSTKKKQRQYAQAKPRPIRFSTSLKPNSSTQHDIDRFGFALSMIYRLRFGIETDWSMFKSFRPSTTSPSGAVRLFYFYVGIIVYNAWLLARSLENSHRRLTRMRFLILYVPISVEVGLILSPIGNG